MDKFYTLPIIAKKCIEQVGQLYDWNSWDLIIEPSAGSGNFYDQIPIKNKIGIDIAPDAPHIICQDFFAYKPNSMGKILVIGNPPFGKVSSLAIKFFNHANWADVIAFILPRTFRRISVQNKLNTHFHLIFDEDIPNKPCSFIPPMAAKCCFQVWEKRPVRRHIVILQSHHSDWEFLPLGPKDRYGQPTPPIGANFAIRAYGGKCGEIIYDNLEMLRPKSWHWIVAKIDVEILKERFSCLDYSICMNTARQNSLGKGELVSAYQAKFG